MPCNCRFQHKPAIRSAVCSTILNPERASSNRTGPAGCRIVEKFAPPSSYGRLSRRIQGLAGAGTGPASQPVLRAGVARHPDQRQSLGSEHMSLQPPGPHPWPIIPVAIRRCCTDEQHAGLVPRAASHAERSPTACRHPYVVTLRWHPRASAAAVNPCRIITTDNVRRAAAPLFRNRPDPE